MLFRIFYMGTYKGKIIVITNNNKVLGIRYLKDYETRVWLLISKIKQAYQLKQESCKKSSGGYLPHSTHMQ